jgi:hypothetical protein
MENLYLTGVVSTSPAHGTVTFEAAETRDSGSNVYKEDEQEAEVPKDEEKQNEDDSWNNWEILISDED